MTPARAGLVPVLAVAGVALVAACEEEPEATAPKETTATESTNAGAGEAEKADVTFTVELSEYEHIAGRHRFYQTRRFNETNGVGVTLTRGKVCVADGIECVETDVEYRIEPNGSFVQKRHYVATMQVPDTATITYWGKDDRGNSLRLTETLSLKKP